MGRPVTVWTPDLIKRATDLAAAGNSIRQTAAALGVTKPAMERARQRYEIKFGRPKCVICCAKPQTADARGRSSLHCGSDYCKAAVIRGDHFRRNLDGWPKPEGEIDFGGAFAAHNLRLPRLVTKLPGRDAAVSLTGSTAGALVRGGAA